MSQARTGSISARFTSGSTMRHVAVMTATSTIGLIALFTVDAANLYYISLLGQTELAAAIGFAGTIQFFMISISIGLAIASTALVSRAIGAGGSDEARRLAMSSLTFLVSILTIAAVTLWFLRGEALSLLGATGEAHDIGADFLAIVLPSLPLLGIAMVSGGLLRSVGDARRSMFVTLSGGIFGALLDPVFIFDWGLGLGIEGAAIVSVLSRLLVASVGLYFVIRTHGMVGRLDFRAVLGDIRALSAIAGPAVATQISTPFGNAYLTRTVSEFGDDAVAGWAVVGRLTALAFGGIFALSGAVGPILGQNLGAGLYPRIQSTFRDALIFASLYVALAWAILFLLQDSIAAGFGLSPTGTEVLRGFTEFGSGAFLFTGALFVSNAVFNNLGKPAWSTLFNWSRDALAIPLFAVIVAGSMGAFGVVFVQGISAILVGTFAALTAWRLVRVIDPEHPLTRVTPMPWAPANPFSSGRSAEAAMAEVTNEPLAKDKNSG